MEANKAELMGDKSRSCFMADLNTSPKRHYDRTRALKTYVLPTDLCREITAKLRQSDCTSQRLRHHAKF